MNLRKSNIVKSITKNSEISTKDATKILESLILLIKNKSKTRIVKLTSFGSFSFKKTPKRLGRNPKTKDSYIIPELNKFNFKPSKKIKQKIN